MFRDYWISHYVILMDVVLVYMYTWYIHPHQNNIKWIFVVFIYYSYCMCIRSLRRGRFIAHYTLACQMIPHVGMVGGYDFQPCHLPYNKVTLLEVALRGTQPYCKLACSSHPDCSGTNSTATASHNRTNFFFRRQWFYSPAHFANLI